MEAADEPNNHQNRERDPEQPQQKESPHGLLSRRYRYVAHATLLTGTRFPLACGAGTDCAGLAFFLRCGADCGRAGLLPCCR
jgi:hypothetical protein